MERNWREAQHAWRLLGDGNILNGEEGGQRGVEEGTPEFRSRGEEKGAKKEFQKENTWLRRKKAFAAFPAIKGSADSSVFVSFVW